MCVWGGRRSLEHLLLTLAAPRANDCISCLRPGAADTRRGGSAAAAASERARPGKLGGAPSPPRGGSRGSGLGAPEARSGDEAASPVAGASRSQGPRTKQGSAGGAAPRAEGGACTCIARRALALPGAPQLRRFAVACSGFTRSHFVSPTPPLPTPPLCPPHPLDFPLLLIKTKK